MKRVSITFLCASLLFSLGAACNANMPMLQSQSTDVEYLTSQHIPISGKVVMAKRIRDKNGEHVLVLNRRAGPSSARPNSGRVEHIELNAAYYYQEAGTWKTEWTVQDFVECPGLDATAEFFTSSLSVTDLNDDGKAEITIPYKLFCGGGIDSSNVKVILREGPLKLAIRGESLVKLPGQEPFGGAHQYDKTLLLPAYSRYKQHLDKIWKVVGVETRK